MKYSLPFYKHIHAWFLLKALYVHLTEVPSSRCFSRFYGSCGTADPARESLSGMAALGAIQDLGWEWLGTQHRDGSGRHSLRKTQQPSAPQQKTTLRCTGTWCSCGHYRDDRQNNHGDCSERSQFPPRHRSYNLHKKHWTSYLHFQIRSS